MVMSSRHGSTSSVACLLDPSAQIPFRSPTTRLPTPSQTAPCPATKTTTRATSRSTSPTCPANVKSPDQTSPNLCPAKDCPPHCKTHWTMKRSYGRPCTRAMLQSRPTALFVTPVTPQEFAPSCCQPTVMSRTPVTLARVSDPSLIPTWSRVPTVYRGPIS